MAKVTTSENARPDLEAIKRAVRELESPKVKRDRERAELFAALYPDIRDQLVAGVSKTAIIKTLVDLSVSISNPMFEELLAAEAKRCGEPVPSKDTEASDDESAGAPQVGAKDTVTA
ncbi:hypothetical protein [Paraburkholderia sp. BCC1885]|uniref:hypothetical protein n=1 Tax=Paraburkholderia sp. BCC1885 TaxID=2562669 RepID=UPI0011841CD7|nr:hypothetical protein [Paraburkholderia sp. BCC1885]